MSNLHREIKQKEIPSFTLTRQNSLLHDKLVNCFSQIVNEGKFILDESVKALEKKISEFCEVDYAVGVASGSDALTISLMACDIGKGDEVITTPFTFFATAAAISKVGAKPVFVDIDPITLNINPNLIEEKITPNTKAIIPVHLYGCPAEMATIVKIAREYNLKIIEDAAQAMGAKSDGKAIGSFGDTGCLSFFPTKNLGAFGDGGMIVTNNLEIAEKIKLLRVHGAKTKYYHDMLGFNSRLDELQAAILNLKLEYIHQWNDRRRDIAKLYNSMLQAEIIVGKLSIQLPQEMNNDHHVYHQYTIRTQQRDKLQSYLKDNGISTAVYYPVPLHLQKFYTSLGYPTGSFPVAEAASSMVLSLPMFPELTDEEVEVVVGKIIDYFAV